MPRSLPALVKALRIGEKAAATGFDWERREDVWAKVREEAAEVEAEMGSQDRERLEGEFGDLFFALVNAARLYGIDPESALERTNKKFIRRFNYMEERAAAKGHTLHELPLAEMEALWQEAKRRNSLGAAQRRRQRLWRFGPPVRLRSEGAVGAAHALPFMREPAPGRFGCGAAGGSGNGVPHRHDTIYSYLIQLLRRQWH